MSRDGSGTGDVTHPWERGVVLGAYRPRLLGDALSEVARALPDRIAVEDDQHSLTYGNLVCAVDRVRRAVCSLAADGVAPVSVVVEHGVEAVIALLGVVTAGRIAVPLDTRDPHNRLSLIHEFADAKLTVAHRASAGVARSVARDGPVLVVEDVAEVSHIETAGAVDSLPPVDLSATGMVVFTSGSTGMPKGVVFDNDTFVDNALRMAYAHALTPDDGIGVPGSLAFGASHNRIFAGLVAGARVCLYDLRERGPGGIPAWANTHSVTWMLLVPSVLRAMIDHAGSDRMDTVRLVTFGGEALYGRDVRLARALIGSDAVFRNRLSSTETQGVAGRVVTVEDERADGVVPVGSLEPWVEARVVDDHGAPVAPGAPGRLVVIGDRLAAGYWKDRALTAERFFHLPDGRRGFRTNDLVRWRDDGALVHIGRSDDRVKVRGALVSPSEVERALARVEGVAAGAVKAFPNSDGGMRLVAYAVPAENAALSPASIRRALAQSVPGQMIPGAVVTLNALPIGTRGKVDHAQLEEPAIAERPYREPRGWASDLAEIFAAVLGLERVGLDDDFFELGGDSLALVELLGAIAERFSVDIPASTVLEAPTVAQLFLRLSHRRRRDASPVVALRRGASATPFFCMTGGGAPAMSLRALSDAMPGVDFYAVQPRGLEERARPDRTVEAAARRSVAALREVQPRGPYALGGYSFGGKVAFEMACQLRAVGENVALLVILDTTAPPGPRSVTNRVRARADGVRARAGHVRDRADALRVNAPTARLRRVSVLTGRAAKFGMTLAYEYVDRRIARATAGLFPRRGFRQYETFARVNRRVAKRYTPSATFDGPVLLVRGEPCCGDLANPDRAVMNDGEEPHDLGWSTFVSGPITVAEVRASHLDLMRRPATEQVAAHVSRALAAACKSVPSG